jgi:hypothetical protein
MPIVKNAKVGDKKCTVLKFGIGDIHVNNCVEPVNSMYFAQHEAKPVEEWGIGRVPDYDGEPTTLEEYTGEVVYLSFERVESIDVIMEILQEVKKRMLAQPQ